MFTVRAPAVAVSVTAPTAEIGCEIVRAFTMTTNVTVPVVVVVIPDVKSTVVTVRVSESV